MPLYSKNSLALAGLRPILSPGLCMDDGQEDFANSEHSGRWTGGAIVIRKTWHDISAETGWGPGTTADELIMELPSSPNWGFYIMDAFIQAKFDVGSSPSGSNAFTLGTSEAPGRNNIITAQILAPQWPPVVQSWYANSATPYGGNIGQGGQTAYRTYRQLYVRLATIGYATLNATPASVTVFGYLVPDATDLTS